jgi:hypothetical protein
VAGLLGNFGAVACPRPMGGSPPAAGAGAGLVSRYRQAGGTGPQRSRSCARTDGRAVLRSPGSLSPVMITIKGAPGGASLLAMAQSPPLTVIFTGKTSAPIRRTGAEPKQRGNYLCWPVLARLRYALAELIRHIIPVPRPSNRS